MMMMMMMTVQLRVSVFFTLRCNSGLRRDFILQVTVTTLGEVGDCQYIDSQFLCGVACQKLHHQIFIYQNYVQNTEVLFFWDTVHIIGPREIQLTSGN